MTSPLVARRSLSASRSTRSSCFALLVLSLATGCAGTRALPAAPTPAPELPWRLQHHDAARDGMGLVAFEITDGRGRVDLVLDRDTGSSVTEVVAGKYYGQATSRATSERRRLLCATPCTAELPLGAHEVRFTGRDGRTTTLIVESRHEPRAVRVTLPRREPHAASQALASVAMILGASAAAGGGVLWGLSEKETSGLQTARTVTLVGAGVFVAGAILGITTAPTFRPGAATQFDAAITPSEPRAGLRPLAKP